MLLQDRIDEAQSLFNIGQKRKRENEEPFLSELQESYMSAYLDFYNEKPTQAREIVGRFQNYPVVKWRKRFQEVKEFSSYLFICLICICLCMFVLVYLLVYICCLFMRFLFVFLFACLLVSEFLFLFIEKFR
jgi:hypothetical protein